MGVYVDTILRRGDKWGCVLPWSDWGRKTMRIYLGTVRLHGFSSCQSTLVLIFQLAEFPPVESLDPWNIQDEYNSEFELFEIETENGTIARYYYAVVEGRSSNYEIEIDGKLIEIS